MDPSAEYWKNANGGATPGGQPFDYAWSAAAAFATQSYFGAPAGMGLPPVATTLGMPSLSFDPHLAALDPTKGKLEGEIKTEYTDAYGATSDMYAAGAAAAAAADHHGVTADSLGGYFSTGLSSANDYEPQLPAGPSGLLGSLHPSMPQSALSEEQLTRQKDAIRAHPLYPFLALLFERCELATSTPRDLSKEPQTRAESAVDMFKEDLKHFVETRRKERFLPSDPEVDRLMISAIQVLRIHLLELEKVHELCDSFCNRYVCSLKDQMQMDVMSEERSSSAATNVSGNGAAGMNVSPQMSVPAHSMSHSYGGPPSYEPQSVPLPETSGLHHLGPQSADPSTSAYVAHHTPQPECATPLGQVGTPNSGERTPASTGYVPNFDQAGGNHSGNSPRTSVSRSGSTPLNNANSSANSSGNAHSTSGQLHDGISDAGDDNLSTGGSIPEDGGRDSVGSENHRSMANSAAPGAERTSKRKVPKVFSKEAITKFRAWLFQNLQHPYPSEDQKKQLAQDTGLTILQVNNWFINARRRIVQPMIDSNNRAGRSPACQVFKNRRRKNSDQSPGAASPSAEFNANPVASYSPDSTMMNAMAASAAASQYNPAAMFQPGYPGFAAGGFASPMFMPGVAAAAYNMAPGQVPGSWMDFGSNIGSMDS